MLRYNDTNWMTQDWWLTLTNDEKAIWFYVWNTADSEGAFRPSFVLMRAMFGETIVYSAVLMRFCQSGQMRELTPGQTWSVVGLRSALGYIPNRDIH